MSACVSANVILVLLGTAVITNVPLYAVSDVPTTITLSPTSSVCGVDVTMVVAVLVALLLMLVYVVANRVAVEVVVGLSIIISRPDGSIDTTFVPAVIPRPEIITPGANIEL